MRASMLLALLVFAPAACGKADPSSVEGIGGAAAPLASPKVIEGKVERTIEDGKIDAEIDAEIDAKIDDATVAPRDAASGLPTGKRQHKPLAVTKPEVAPDPPEAGERPYKEFTVTKPQ